MNLVRFLHPSFLLSRLFLIGIAALLLTGPASALQAGHQPWYGTELPPPEALERELAQPGADELRRADCLGGLAMNTLQSGDPKVAEEYFERALEALLPAGDSTRDLAYAHWITERGNARSMSAELDRADQDYLVARARYDRHGVQPPATFVRKHAICLFYQDRLPEAQGLALEALELALKGGDRYQEARARSFLGGVLSRQGFQSAACTEAELALAIFEEIEEGSLAACNALQVLAGARTKLGHYDEAEPLLEKFIEYADRHGPSPFPATARQLLFYNEYRRHQDIEAVGPPPYERMLELLDGAMAKANEFGPPPLVQELSCDRILLHIAAEDWDAARREFEESAELRESAFSPSQTCRYLCAEATLEAHGGNFEVARALLGRARELEYSREPYGYYTQEAAVRVAELEGDLEAALAAERELHGLKLADRERERALAVAEREYLRRAAEHEQDLELAELRRQHEVETLETQRQHEEDSADRRALALAIVSGLLVLVIGLTVHIARQRRHAERLEHEAQSANRTKSAFLANMSHEIRGPMNVIQGNADLLTGDSHLTSDQTRGLLAIQRSSRHLSDLLAGVLDMSRIEAGRFELENWAYSPAEVLAEVHSMFAPRASGQGIALSAEWNPSSPAWNLGDRGRLRQILVNLTDNALRHTSSGGVHLTGEVNGNRIEFSVADTGSGIPSSELDAAFQRFEGVGGRPAGSGLGLPISLELAVRMGGTLKAESRDPGTEFRLSLPYQPCEPPERHTTGPLPFQDQDLRRALVLDDEEEQREVTRKMMTSLGFEVYGASNVDSAEELLVRESFAAAIVDLRMPRQDGLTFLRRHAAEAGPLCVAVSANAFSEDRQAALDAGAVAFLPKPLQQSELGRVLHTHLIAES